MLVKDLRDSFINFFADREHRIVSSSSLLPKDDPTLLFTTAGMVQFKAMFAGSADLEYTRAASIQRCLRTSDLENVGRTKRHLTLFEMLGNFSFGDYFKKEAVEFAWDYSTEVIGFEKNKIWASIYQDDDEAYEIWNKRIGIPAERIVRLGKADNFWGPAGDSGACGPCSELYIDRGEAYGCNSIDCKPGCDCERFLEYWNLVFVQFNQDAAGKLTPLPRTGIDTGMGLERLATLIQGVDSVYQTDELASLIKFVSEKSGVKYEGVAKHSINVMVEHARALTFAMSDGIYPSNEGRGYVLRRILRRGLRFSRQIGITEPFIHKMVDPIVALMGKYYSELNGSTETVKNLIESEERRFLETLENGMDRLEEIMKTSASRGDKTISGKEAFVLYDTFGFPFEMTLEIASEKGLSIDKTQYDAEMENQRERGKQSWKGAFEETAGLFAELASKCGDTIFTGYKNDSYESAISALASDKSISNSLSEGSSGFIVLKETPFYGESGGQLGDKGTISSDDKSVFLVEDVKKSGKTTIHIGRVIKGQFKTGDKVSAEIDLIARNLTRANHTATHLLQAALRVVLGEHVRQAGSMVSFDRMRFDFSHFDSLSAEETARIESIVNEKIWEGIPVSTDALDYNEAVKSGATAMFDEKYEDVVRVVSVPGFSKELCGGTHVSNTGQIGLFKILKESSPGAGMRRIEGITLKGILDRYNERDALIGSLTSMLNISETGIVKKIADLIDENKSLEKEIAKIRSAALSSNIDSIINSGTAAGGIKIFSKVFGDADTDALRKLIDTIRSREQSSAVFFGCLHQGKPMLIFAAAKTAVDKGIDCGAIIKEAVKEIGGGGGGRKDMAQAGGKDSGGLERAVESAVNTAKRMVG